MGTENEKSKRVSDQKISALALLPMNAMQDMKVVPFLHRMVAVRATNRTLTYMRWRRRVIEH